MEASTATKHGESEPRKHVSRKEWWEKFFQLHSVDNSEVVTSDDYDSDDEGGENDDKETTSESGDSSNEEKEGSDVESKI